MVWPDGQGTRLQLRGRARDLLTPATGGPVVLAEASMVVGIDNPRAVATIEVTPSRPGIERLVGAQGGSNFRSAIDAAIPGEREAATPLYFLLDDIAGASLIAGFAWSQSKDAPAVMRPPPGPAGAPPAEPIGVRKGRIICSGLRPGGYQQRERMKGNFNVHYLRRAGDLSTDDPWAWHDIEPAPEVCMRRRRRVDVWPVDGELVVDAHFRDSLWRWDGTELALHEYTAQVTVDAGRRIITRIAAQPRVLPFPECPGAAPHVQQLVGMQVDSFRTSVQESLRELEACTHLNDMLRCLAEAASLADAIPSVTA